MAIRKARRLNKISGKVEKSTSWHIYFHDHHQREHSFATGTDLDEARRLEIKIRNLVGCRKNGFYPPEMTDWIDGLPGALRKKLARWDLLSGGRVAAGIPLAEHLADWRTHLIASGVTVKQAELLHSRAERVFTAAGFSYLPDISASKALNTIDGLAKIVKRKDSKTGKMELVETARSISSMTKKHHLRAVKQFTKWLKTDGRASNNPLDNLTIKGAVVENQRRALSQAEIVYLLDYTTNAGVLQGMTGAERALIYRLAIETGLRANEIASLKRTSFDFEGLSVRVEATDTKNKKPALLPVKTGTMARIKEQLAGKMPTAAAFGLNPKHGAKLIQADIKNARTGWIDSVKDNPAEHRQRVESDFLAIKTDKGKIDFHSLRHCFGSILAASGVHPKTAQALMRHSKIELTMSIYTHVQDDKLTEAIDNLPDFDTNRQIALKTGTDNFTVDATGQNRAEINTPKKTPNQTAKHSKSLHKSAQKNGENLKSKNVAECLEKPVIMQKNGEGGIRTLGAGYYPHDGLANRCLQPLGHLSRL